jgi:hypothetical protein
VRMSTHNFRAHDAPATGRRGGMTRSGRQAAVSESESSGSYMPPGVYGIRQSAVQLHTYWSPSPYIRLASCLGVGCTTTWCTARDFSGSPKADVALRSHLWIRSHLRRDKTNTGFGGQRVFPAAANGVQRRQTRAEVPKKEEKKEGSRRFWRIGFHFIYRMFGIYGLRILSRYRPIYSS